jgi:hypothetical protein
MGLSRIGRICTALASCIVILTTASLEFVQPAQARASATAHTVTATYTGVPGTGIQISTARPSLAMRKAYSYHQIKTDISPSPRLTSPAPVKVTDSGWAQDPATVGKLLHNFNGLSDRDSVAVNAGLETTPPDQGLCVGFDPGVPGRKVVFETVNRVVRETALNGGALPGTPLLRNRDFNLVGFFSDPNAFTDPRCFYEPSTRSFYFTVLTGPGNTATGFDVAVFNAKGFAVYQFNASFGGRFFPDQPHVGYDRNNLYVSTDQFSPGGVTPYFGAALFAISKSQLVAEVASPSFVRFGPLSLGGIPVIALQPAVSTSPTRIEYLLNSFPFLDAALHPNPISTQLGLWTVHNGAGVTTGGTVTLTGRIIRSEPYAFPVPALSTGSGRIISDSITSEAALAANDDRLMQVQFIHGYLWAALTTAVSIDGDPTTRDGIAWFKVDPVRARVTRQGYVSSLGRYLIFPSIMRTREGTTAIVFTITSPSLNPSAAYVVSRSDAGPFRRIHITARGTSPHVSFSDVLAGKPRWGDYSAATLDPNGRNIWLATEYIPPLPNQEPSDNWGTRIFDVKGI